MEDNLAIFLVLTIAITAAVILMVTMSWMRLKRRALELQPAGLATIEDENATLKAQVARLEERLHVLERIAVDPSERTAREIELLR
jgi:hypothetical protein